MDAIARGLIVYLFLLVITRISGKRTLAEVTTFDFVLLLIISETTQQALMSNDFSLTNAAILIVTLLGMSIFFSLVERNSPRLRRWLNGQPLIIVRDGQPLKDRMDKERVDVEEVLEAARRLQGLERLDQIKYAVLEQDGAISIIPREAEARA